MCEDNKCELCRRTDAELDFHHLVPKKEHSKNKFKRKFSREYMKKHGIMICKDYCHKDIHHLFTEKELAMYYYTLELLLASPKVQKYLTWRLKQKS